MVDEIAVILERVATARGCRGGSDRKQRAHSLKHHGCICRELAAIVCDEKAAAYRESSRSGGSLFLIDRATFFERAAKGFREVGDG